MKITNLTSQISKLMRKGSPEEVQKPPAPSDVKKPSDTLEISSKAKEVKDLVARALVDSSETGRVQAIKEKIAQGTYEMDSRKLAEKMLSKD